MTTTNTAAVPGTHVTTTGATLWLTGLPSAGKTTLARALSARLVAAGRNVEVLDGDELRTHLTRDLGFSREDREENVRRVGFVASLLARNGILTLVPVIAPYASARESVRRLHASSGAPYVEVHVATPLAVCSDRDVKGLYARQRSGEISGLTGVDDPYEEPLEPDLRLDTTDRDLDASVDALVALLNEKGLL